MEVVAGPYGLRLTREALVHWNLYCEALCDSLLRLENAINERSSEVIERGLDDVPARFVVQFVSTSVTFVQLETIVFPPALEHLETFGWILVNGKDMERLCTSCRPTPPVIPTVYVHCHPGFLVRGFVRFVV